MAMIDYGAIVIKNGKVINENQFFMDMFDSVGWSDAPAKYHEDCTCFDKRTGESLCWECDRWNNDDGVDCHGEEHLYDNKRLDHNYYAYVGDKGLTLSFYKSWMAVAVDGVRLDGLYPRFYESSSVKSHHYNFNGTKVDIKSIYGNSILLARFKYNGDFYRVIFGYGIDTSKRVWDNVKVRYVGKKIAKMVDKILKGCW